MNIRFPEYELYGERQNQKAGDSPDFWIHCEAIRDRSRLHGWEIKPHSHRRFIQLLYIWSGSAEIVTPETTMKVAIPAVIEVPRRSVHGFRFTSDVCGFVLSVVPEELACLDSARDYGQGASDVRQTHLAAGDNPSERLDHMLREIELEYEQRGLGHRAVLDACVSASLILLARFNAPENAQACDLVARNRARIHKLERLIAANFRSRKPAEFYAEALGISTAHLNRLCRNETGRSVGEMIAAKIIEEACRSLVFSVHSVKQIAYNLGFDDPAYFTRFFVRRTGKQPTAYRREQQRRLETQGQSAG